MHLLTPLQVGTCINHDEWPVDVDLSSPRSIQHAAHSQGDSVVRNLVQSVYVCVCVCLYVCVYVCVCVWCVCACHDFCTSEGKA